MRSFVSLDHLPRHGWETTVVLIVVALSISGCGPMRGDGGPEVVERPVTRSNAREQPRIIATLGDSIVAGSPLWDPDVDVRASFASVDRASQWQRWVPEPGAELRNCGVWGERTDEIARRYADCTRGADAVVIQGGINDIVQGRPVADAAHDLACIAERARRDGLDVALIDVLPWNNGWPQAAAKVRELNRSIHALGRQGGVPVLPFFATLEDPDRRDRMPRSLTIDGNHPDVRGYRLLGRTAWRRPVRAAARFVGECRR